MIPKNHKNSRPIPSSSPGKVVPLAGYEQHKGEIALRMTHFFMRYLNAIYNEFEGDLALAIVLGEVTHRNVSRNFSSDGPLPPFGKTDYDDPNPMRALNPAMRFHSPPQESTSPGSIDQRQIESDHRL